MLSPKASRGSKRRTIIRYDQAVQLIREHEVYRDKISHLRSEDGTLKECKGNYLLVDNGCHKGDPCSPNEDPAGAEEARWSKALESVRKDVECVSGVLKCRFRILKLPILYQSKERIDNVFLTCCVLHTMSHTLDGLDALEGNVNWAGADGLHETYIADPFTDVSFVGTRSRSLSEKIEIESAHHELK